MYINETHSRDHIKELMRIIILNFQLKKYDK